MYRSIRMVGDAVITGSDDWTARMWSVSRGTCDAVLACHGGPILCVEYSISDKGIITGLKSSFLVFVFLYFTILLHSEMPKFSGSTDGLLRFWENDNGENKNLSA